MKLTPLQLALTVSMLVHGTIFSAAYVIRQGELKLGSRSNSVDQQALEIVVESESEVPRGAEQTSAAVEWVSVPELAGPEPDVREISLAAPDADIVDFFRPEQTAPLAGEPPAQTATNVPNESVPEVGDAACSSSAFASRKADYLICPKPIYPWAARQHRQEGLVVLSAWLTAGGIPEQVEVRQSSGFLLLDEAALKSVRCWRFAPALLENQTVSSQIEIPIRFQLVDREFRERK